MCINCVTLSSRHCIQMILLGTWSLLCQQVENIAHAKCLHQLCSFITVKLQVKLSSTTVHFYAIAQKKSSVHYGRYFQPLIQCLGTLLKGSRLASKLTSGQNIHFFSRRQPPRSLFPSIRKLYGRRRDNFQDQVSKPLRNLLVRNHNDVAE